MFVSCCLFHKKGTPYSSWLCKDFWKICRVYFSSWLVNLKKKQQQQQKKQTKKTLANIYKDSSTNWCIDISTRNSHASLCPVVLFTAEVKIWYRYDSCCSWSNLLSISRYISIQCQWPSILSSWSDHTRPKTTNVFQIFLMCWKLNRFKDLACKMISWTEKKLSLLTDLHIYLLLYEGNYFLTRT